MSRGSSPPKVRFPKVRCDRLGLRFVDVWDQFQGREGLYANAMDRIHLNFKGYKVFGQVVDRELERKDVLLRQGNF